MAAWAWTRVPSVYRRRTAVLFVALVGAVGVVFLAVQPNLPGIVWAHFAGSTAGSRLIGGETSAPLRTLNVNIRDTVTASVSALGVLNFVGLLAWALFDRALPRTLDRRLVGLWLAPWLLVFVLIHVGKPGYVLPLLPLASLVVGGFYARQRRGVAFALIAAGSVANVAEFAYVHPASQATLGGVQRYRDKTLLQRAASDLQTLTFPTAFTIAQSDAHVARLMTLAGTICPPGDSIIIAGLEPVDWRRVMWYFQSATAIHISGERVAYIGTQTNVSSPVETGTSLRTECPIIWLTPDDTSTGLPEPTAWTRAPDLGWMTGPGTIRVTPMGITLLAPSGAATSR